MSRWNLTLLLAAGGCGATWGFGGEANDVLYTQCAEPKTYYFDGDGDGWGDPDQPGVADACEPDASNFFTATNAKDCDDDDVDVTGLVGSLCPAQLADTSGEISYVGKVTGGNEFTYVHGASPAPIDVRDAEERCAQWGATELIDGVWNSTGGLATFGLGDSALEDLQKSVEANVESNFVAFVGVEWSGSILDGAWSWTDDSDDARIDSIGWCADESPLPEDFFPGLNPNDADHAQIIEDGLEWIRLALITDGETWCLGLPTDASTLDSTSVTSTGTELDVAHVMCERLPPNPTDYEVSYVEGADGS
jgi:hypothetical protein